MKKILMIVALMSAGVAGWACTNFIVGKDASADGSTMISYAADSYTLYGFLHFVPAADHAEGEMREVRDWDTNKPLGQIPQVAHTYTVVGNMNEKQLTIGETTWGGRPELWDTVGIDYGSLIYIALERCTTAREAILCMVNLVNEYGYASEGETFSIGDPNEVWMMDMIGKGFGNKGAAWVAVRIPDSCISAHANQTRIQQIPMPSKKALKKAQKTGYVDLGNWMYDKDVIAFAKEQGFYEGEDKNFSYQKAYGPYDFTGLYVCEGRVWSFFKEFKNMDAYYDFAMGNTFVQTKGEDAGEPMPLWIKPDRKVTLADMRRGMRDHYDGTEHEITQGKDAGAWGSKLRYGGLMFEVDSAHYCYPRPIATQQTGWSYIAQMRKDNPAGGIFWFGVDDAATNLYVPLYSSLQEVPNCLKEGNGDMYTYSATSAWWTYNLVANWAYSKYGPMRKDIVQVQQAWEQKWDEQVPGMDERAAQLEENERKQFLSRWSVTQSEQSTQAWQKLYIYLITKYLDGQERKEENGQFKRNAWGCPVGPNRVALPEEWRREVAPDVASY